VLDTLIAGIALRHGAILVTHNLDEFRRIDRLAVEDGLRRASLRRRMRALPAMIGGIRVHPMRLGRNALTRDGRQRLLPTKNCHAALCRDLATTREYQSHSSSKPPEGPSSVVSGWFLIRDLRGPPPPQAATCP
jgi:hypothetical protein